MKWIQNKIYWESISISLYLYSESDYQLWKDSVGWYIYLRIDIENDDWYNLVHITNKTFSNNF